MKVIIAGGGTGGHVYPLVPIAEEFKKNGDEVVFVGRKDKIEHKIFTSYGFPVEFVSAAQFDFNLKSIFKFVLNLVKGFFDALKIISKHKPDVILGAGGYVSLPVLVAGIVKKVPIFIYEQNIIPGRTNQFLGKFARLVFLGFPVEEKFFKSKGIFVGNPVRKEVIGVDKEKALKFFNFEDKFTLLIFGGSGGAYKLNKIAYSILPEILTQDIQVIFITGERFFEEFKDKISHKNLRMLPYLNEMGFAYAVSSLAISRGGAMTLTELVLNGVYSIVVPFPYARDNHQYYNAKYFESFGCVEVIEEKNLTEKILLDRIIDIKDKINIMRRDCRNIYPKNSEVEIVRKIKEYYG